MADSAARAVQPAGRLRRRRHRRADPGEISARCHDEQANFLALNLAHDIVTGAKDVQEARAYYPGNRHG